MHPAGTVPPPPAPQQRLRNKWSIGIFAGPNPLALKPAHGISQPVLTARDVTDVRAHTVADPFLIRRDGRWYLFFEVLNGSVDRGEIAYATSDTGLSWTYGAVVLREPFHLSYPHILAWRDEIYMIPETRQAESVRLYRAEEFPRRWKCIATLLRGRYADTTVVRHRERWWLFAQRGLDELRLFSNANLTGEWQEHVASPLWPGNRRRTRPGGRIIVHDGRLLRFAQDGWPSYGSRLLAFEIDRLDEQTYAEHEVAESPLLRASGSGWNAVGMHHLDAVQRDDGSWLAAVDGATPGLF